MSHYDRETYDDRMVQLREEQRQFLIKQDQRVRRLAALETALAYELRAHEVTKRQLARANEQIEQIRSKTHRIASDTVMVCEVHGVEVFCHFEAHSDGITISDVFVEPEQSIVDILGNKEMDHLAGQIADSLEAEARNA